MALGEGLQRNEKKEMEEKLHHQRHIRGEQKNEMGDIVRKVQPT